MNKRFDPKKLTLTDFKPSEFKDATSKLFLEQKKASVPAVSSDAVPEGRTTLHLKKQRGVITGESAKPASSSEEIKESVPSIPSANHVSDIPPSAHHDNQTTTLSIPTETLSQGNSTPHAEADSQNVEIITLPIANGSILLTASSSPTIDERSAALHTRTIRHKKRESATINPEDSVPFNTRQPKWLKDAFFKACHEKGATPSIVLRNLMKAYCGLCLVLSFFTISHAAVPQDSGYSTEQLLNYFYSKTFGLKSLVPDIKSSVAVRHSLWSKGAQDSADYIYADRSNTRLEAKLEIPILDFSYLKDRSKDKIELRAYVMKSLSKILAAQKSVSILETRAGTVRSRIDYMKNQVTLKILNKSDLFPVENEYYTIQSQLYEAQSELEQRIIELSVIAGNEWLEAYQLIIKWDGKLFNQNE